MQKIFSALILIGFICLYSCKTTYNIDPSKPNPYDTIEALHKGTLVVCLKSDRQKLIELDKLRNSQTLSNIKKERAALEYARTMHERRETVQKMKGWFADSYSFSNVVFSYDYAIKEIVEGQREIIEVGDGESAGMIQLEEPFYMARLEPTYLDKAYLFSWRIINANAEVIPAPFPELKPKIKHSLRWFPKFLAGNLNQSYYSNAGYFMETNLEKFYRKAKRKNG